MTAQPHDRLWDLGAPPARPRLEVGAKVEVLALPPSLAEAGWARTLLRRVGTVTDVHDYEQCGFAEAVGHEVLYDVQVPGYASFPLAPHEIRPLDDTGQQPLAIIEAHAIGSMDPHDPERFRLSAETERHAARAWMVAAVQAGSSAEVLACTQLGRTALRQAHEYGRLADELVLR